MYDCPSVVQTILKAFLAKSTLALNKSGTTVLPCRAFIELFCKVSHIINGIPTNADENPVPDLIQGSGDTA